MVNFGNAGPRWVFAVARAGGQAIADGVGRDHEVPRRVDRLARADHEVDPVVVAGIAATIRIALTCSCSVAVVTYEIAKSRIVSPLSSYRSPS